MNWYKIAQVKRTDNLIYDIYKSVQNKVGGNWIITKTTGSLTVDSKVYHLQKYLIINLDGRSVIKDGDAFFVKLQISIKRTSGKILHPYDGTYEGAKNWNDGKILPIGEIDYNYQEEELKKRWKSIYELPVENASTYDIRYGNRLFDINVVIDGMKPSLKTKPEEYNSISTFFNMGKDIVRIGTSRECDSPDEIADYIKREINKFYFGNDDNNDENNYPLSPIEDKTLVHQ